MSRFEELATMAARVPWIAALGLKPAERALGLVDLPRPSGGVRSEVPRFKGEPGFDVVIMPDVFTSALDPETLTAAVEVLDALGYRTGVSPFVPSGKFDHVKGRRARFAKAAARQARMVNRIAASGAIPVVIEPAVALLHQHEYAATVGGYPVRTVQSLVDLIIDRADQLASVGAGRTVRLLGHCTERAVEPHHAAGWATVLEAAGFDVDVPEVGCCGMAGVFGHEADNRAMSKQLWHMSWANQVETSSAVDVVAAPGYSCRSQAQRFGTAQLLHPLRLLRE